MTAGDALPLIIRFTVPIFIGNFFQQLYNLADTLIVGWFLGSNALAAVGSTGTDVLVNKLEIRNRDDLFNAERDITGLRLLQMKEKPVRGKFDFNRLLRIHKSLFDDL